MDLEPTYQALTQSRARYNLGVLVGMVVIVVVALAISIVAYVRATNPPSLASSAIHQDSLHAESPLHVVHSSEGTPSVVLRHGHGIRLSSPDGSKFAEIEIVDVESLETHALQFRVADADNGSPRVLYQLVADDVGTLRAVDGVSGQVLYSLNRTCLGQTSPLCV